MGTLLGMKNVRGQLLMHVVGVDQLDALVGYVLHSLLDLLRPVALLAFGIRDAGINPGPDLGETLVLVGHRKLRALPASLCRLEKLKHLRVDNNALRKLPACIGDLHALDTLVAYGNALKELPESLAELKRLKWLEVQMNLMKKPPPVLSRLKVRHPS